MKKKISLFLAIALIVSAIGIVAYAGCAHSNTNYVGGSTYYETIDARSHRLITTATYECATCHDKKTVTTRHQKSDHNWETIVRANGSYQRCRNCGYCKR